jgi:hypothetical protein
VAVFVIGNRGARAFGLRASGGALLAAVDPGGVVACHLDDNSTAAGSWSVEGAGLAAGLVVQATTWATTITQVSEIAVRLTDSLSLHAARNASGHPFVRSCDHSVGGAGFGVAVLLTAANVSVLRILRISDSKALIALSGGTLLHVTVSGTTCTVSSTISVASGVDFILRNYNTVARLSDTLLVSFAVSAGAITAVAIDSAGTVPVGGTPFTAVAAGVQQRIGIWPVSATTALLIYLSDNGTPGDPYSISARVLSVSGTTISAGTVADLADVASPASSHWMGCALSATSYIVTYVANATADPSAVALSVSGTTVTFGAPVVIEAGSSFAVGSVSADAVGGQGIVPNLAPLTAATALLTYGGPTLASDLVRHVVLSVSGTTVTIGAILYGPMPTGSTGVVLAPPTAAGTGIVVSVGGTAGAINKLIQLTISGTTVAVSGDLQAPDGVQVPRDLLTAGLRFGLSAGVVGFKPINAGYAAELPGRLVLSRNNPGGAPRYLGTLVLPGVAPSGAASPLVIEVAPTKLAYTEGRIARSQSATMEITTLILEVPV